MTQHPDNVKRGDRACNAVSTYGQWKVEPEIVRALLADLRHFCDTRGINFLKEDRIAHDDYISEVKDPAL